MKDGMNEQLLQKLIEMFSTMPDEDGGEEALDGDGKKITIMEVEGEGVKQPDLMQKAEEKAI